MSMQLGEAYVGDGAEAAHVNTVFGTRNGPVGTAWATALATPRIGHVPFVAVLRPGLPVQPMTLFVNKAAIASEHHGALTWGAAQAGVAGGVADAVGADLLDGHGGIDDQCLIVAVWVDPAAADEELVYANNRAATFQAIQAGAKHLPRLADVLSAHETPSNPYFRRG